LGGGDDLMANATFGVGLFAFRRVALGQCRSAQDKEGYSTDSQTLKTAHLASP
jgi:hypothetical protein